MTRFLLLATAVIAFASLVNSAAEAVTQMQCEERMANCNGGCRDTTGGAGDLRGHPSRCTAACIRRLTACYAISRPLYWPGRDYRPRW
jgi:hypothetical protein